MTGVATRARVLLVDHRDSYTFNLAHLIAGVTGELPHVVDHEARIALSSYTHVVLSPGPGHPAEWSAGVLGERVFDAGLPVLGVCLGMQALVLHHGGAVTPIAPAHGVVARIEHLGSGLFAGIEPAFAAVRYHSLAATRVPPELEVTASSEGVVMAVRHRSLPLSGVQFHPESILSEHGSRIIANFLEAA